MNDSHVAVYEQCPVCYCTTSTLIEEVSSEQAAQHFILKEKDAVRHEKMKSHITAMWHGQTCKMVQCSACQFIYAYPYQAGDAIFYSLMYDKPGYPKWKWDFEVTYHAITSQLNKEQFQYTNLLEIGAGDGAFLQKIATLIPRKNITATEFSEYGAHEIRKKEIECLSVDFRTIRDEKYKERFNIICAFQVLEHLDNLDGFFEQLQWLAAPGARVFIAVPNTIRVMLNMRYQASLDMPPVHVGRWFKQTFEIIGKRHHWKLIDHQIAPESLLWKYAEFSLYRYNRATKKSGTIYNFVESIRPSLPRKFFQIILISWNALLSLPVLPRLARPDTGDSQWVQFEKM